MAEEEGEAEARAAGGAPVILNSGDITESLPCRHCNEVAMHLRLSQLSLGKLSSLPQHHGIHAHSDALARQK